MKELLEFFKDRMTNKFFLPFIFLFVANNWKIFVWLFLDKNPPSIIENISFYIGLKGYFCIILVPFIEAILFSIFSPWLSLSIEYLIDWPNLLRKRNKIKAEIGVIEEQSKLADAQYTLAQKQALIKAKGSSRDSVIFGNISQKLDEAGFKSTLDMMEKSADVDNFKSAIKRISEFRNYVSLTDQWFHDESIKKRMDDIVEAIDDIIDVQRESPKPEIGQEEFLEGIGRIRDVYSAYRTTVRDRLGY